MPQRTALHDAIEAIKGKPYRLNDSDRCAYVFTGVISEKGSILAYNLTADRDACFRPEKLHNFSPPQSQPDLTEKEKETLRYQQSRLGVDTRVSA